MAHTEQQKRLILEVFECQEDDLTKKYPPYDHMQIAKKKGYDSNMQMAIWKGISIEEWNSICQHLRDIAKEDEKEGL